jgi:hypothetical protein
MSVETEIQHDIEALRGRFSDTKALYREVCALLFFRYGLTPTASKLYQYVRKGSMSAPAEALAKFWDDLRSKARVEIDHPDLPPQLAATAAGAIAEIWRQATAAARGELAAVRVELQADQERARHEQAQAEQTAAQSLATADQLRVELARAHEMTEQVRIEREAEGRAHAGTVARLQELQAQLEQARAQQQLAQERFSADLAKAREAVDAADQRAAAAERRALMEVEQERQARAKADKQVETLRAQLAQGAARERQVALEHAEAIARLQTKLDTALATERASKQAQQMAEQNLRAVRDQLQASLQEATLYRSQAQAVQAVLDRMVVPALASPKPARKRASS